MATNVSSPHQQETCDTLTPSEVKESPNDSVASASGVDFDRPICGDKKVEESTSHEVGNDDTNNRHEHTTSASVASDIDPIKEQSHADNRENNYLDELVGYCFRIGDDRTKSEQAEAILREYDGVSKASAYPDPKQLTNSKSPLQRKRGRPRLNKTKPTSEKTKTKTGCKKAKTKISLGSHYERWNAKKQELGINLDSDMAAMLLDLLDKYEINPSSDVSIDRNSKINTHAESTKLYATKCDIKEEIHCDKETFNDLVRELKNDISDTESRLPRTCKNKWKIGMVDDGDADGHNDDSYEFPSEDEDGECLTQYEPDGGVDQGSLHIVDNVVAEPVSCDDGDAEMFACKDCGFTSHNWEEYGSHNCCSFSEQLQNPSRKPKLTLRVKCSAKRKAKRTRKASVKLENAAVKPRHPRQRLTHLDCTVCGFAGSRNVKQYEGHFAEAHPFVDQHLCNTCSFTTNSIRSMVKHRKTQHCHSVQFTCEVEGCTYKTHEKAVLRKHIYTHTGEKPYSCDKCEYRAAQQSTLRSHQAIHKPEHPFQCDECGKRFKRLRTFQRHLHTHSDDYPFRCPICPFKTRQRSNLTVHERIHSGEKPYLCSLCGYATHYPALLKKHQCPLNNVALPSARAQHTANHQDAQSECQAQPEEGSSCMSEHVATPTPALGSAPPAPYTVHPTAFLAAPLQRMKEQFQEEATGMTPAAMDMSGMMHNAFMPILHYCENVQQQQRYDLMRSVANYVEDMPQAPH